MSTSVLEPRSTAAAPPMPDVMPVAKVRKGAIGFIRRYPTIALGGFLLALLVFVAVFAPYLWTVDPTALAPARRTREPSAMMLPQDGMIGGVPAPIKDRLASISMAAAQI